VHLLEDLSRIKPSHGCVQNRLDGQHRRLANRRVFTNGRSHKRKPDHCSDADALHDAPLLR